MRFFTILVENFDGSQRPIRWPERPKTMGDDGREAMGGDCYVYNQWAICAKSLPIASKTEGGGGVFVVFFLIKGIKVTL
jgi:hypothetical protein